MKKVILLVVFLPFLFFSQNNSKVKIGVALAGGGALGFAHIGALEVIDSLEIPIDYVAGTSMGGLVGAFVAMGYSPNEIENIVLNEMNWNDIFNDSPSRFELPFIEKEITSKEQLVLKLANNYIPQLPEGFLEGQNIYLTLLKYTTPFETVRDFSRLPVPLKVVAVDLVTGEERVLQKGSLAFAMRSTMSIPTIFSPTEYGDNLLIDGGVINNFPVDVVKKMGADIVIGLNLTAPLKKKEELTDLMSILNRTTDIPRFNVLSKNIKLSDIYIPQDIQGYTPGDFEYGKIKELIARGKKAAYEHLDELIKLKKKIDKQGKNNKIKKINVSGADYFTKSQIAKMLGLEKGKELDFAMLDTRKKFYEQNPFIKNIEVKTKQGADGVSIDISVSEEPHPQVIDYDVLQSGRQEGLGDDMFVNVFKAIKNKPLNLNVLFDKIRYLYSFGYFKTIRFEVFNEGNNKIRLLFDVATDYMKEIFFSVHYDDYYQLIGLAGLKVNSTLIPGLRWDVLGAFSGISAFRSKLSFPSRSLDEIFYPFWEFSISERTQDIYLLGGDVSTAEFYYKSLYNKLGIGITPSRFTNLEIGYNIEWVNIRPSVGLVAMEDINYHMNDLFAVMKIDALDDFNYPKNGFYLHGDFYFSSTKLGSHYDYKRFSLMADAYKTFGINGFRVMGFYFQSWGDEPFPRMAKILGGPSSFVGWEYSAAMFIKVSMVRLEYHLNFWNNVYFDLYGNSAFNYDVLLFDSSQKEPNKIFLGVGLGLTYDSIIGPVRIIWAWGDNSVINPREYAKRVYFTLGVKVGDLFEH